MTQCKICGGSVVMLGVKDGFEVFWCGTCGTAQRDVADEVEYMELYESGRYYTELQSEREGYDEETRFDHDLKVSEVRVNNIIDCCCFDGLLCEASILDVGCGNGALCASLLAAGADDVRGVDPDPHVINLARGFVPGGGFMIGTIRDVPLVQFDIVMFTDSFEHDLDPAGCLGEAAARVNPIDGVVVIETPDCGCSEFSINPMDWRHMKPREHPFLYSRMSVGLLAERSGLGVTAVRYTIPGRATYFLRRHP